MEHIKKSYLVASPGRTGSTLIMSLLVKNLKLLKYENNFHPFAVQSHDPKWQLDTNITVIKSVRKNLFDTIVSACIASYYNEWVKYTNIIKPPLIIKFEDFQNKYQWIRRWYDAFDYYTTYNHIITIDYDKLIENHNYLFDTLGLTDLYCYNPTSQPSPRDISVISNIQEIKNWFNELEQNEFINKSPVHFFDWTISRVN